MSVTILYLAGLAAACAALAGIALFFSRQFFYAPEEGLALAILTVMGTVFLSAWAGVARIAVFALCALAAAGYLLRATGRRIGPKRPLPGGKPDAGPFLTPAIRVFFGMILLSAVLFSGTCLQNWDEFVQWGKAVRYMGATGSLPVGAAYDGLEYMHSISTFFHYFTGFFTGFDEASLYVSNAILCLGCVPLTMAGQTHRRCLLFSLFLLLALYALYELPFYNLYVDVALSLWTGALLCYGADFPGQKTAPRKWALACAMFIAVAAMKPTAGILFAAMALLALAVILFPPAHAGFSRRKKLALLLLIPVAAATPFLIRALWSAFVSEGGIYVDWSLLKARRHLLRPLFYTMHRGMFKGLGHADHASYLACFTVSAVLLAAGRRIFTEGVRRTRWTRTAALYSIGFAGYAAILFATYLLILPETDGLNGTSLSRYLSLYAMAGLLPVCAPFFRAEPAPARPGTASSDPDRKKEGTFPARFAVCLFLTAALALTLKSDSLYCATSLLRWDDPYYTMYMDVRACVEEVLRTAEDGTAVYFVCQTSDSAAAAAEYAFAGRWDRSVGAYRFTENADAAVTGLSESTAEDLPSLLLSSGASYLYVDRSDAYFSEAFERTFSLPAPRDGNLYSIESDPASGTVLLRLVENARDLARDPAELEKKH